MKKPPFIAIIFTILIAGAAFAQHRKPGESAPPQQPQQPPQQAQPRDGDKARPREAPPREGQPRDGRSEPEHQGPVVVVPAPGWPWGYPYPYGYPPYGFRVYTDWETCDVRLEVKPEDARVFVDNYYAGIVDEFDGMFQHLTLRPGPHLIEIRKPGFKSLAVELNVYPGQSVTYRQTMEPSDGNDEAAPVVPIAPAFEEGALLPPVDAPPGDLRFDVTPAEAAIYADGFYVGTVDDFNGSQHMKLTEGRHHLMLTLAGYETIELDVSIGAEQTITYRATMKKKS